MARQGIRGLARGRLRPTVFAAIALFASGVGLAGYAADPLEQLELKSVDARFAIRGERRAPSDVVLVTVHTATFSKLGAQWPFPRRWHGRVLDAIMRDRPKAVVFDIQTSEASIRGQDDDLAFLDAISRADGKVVLSNTEPDAKGNFVEFGSGEGRALLKEVGARAGDGAFPNDSDGVLRRMRYEIDHLKTLPVATAEVVTGRRAPAPPGGDAWIDYYGKPGALRDYEYADVLKRRLPRGTFKDKVVIVGVNAAVSNLQDAHETSVSRGRKMGGAEVQGHALGTVLADYPLRNAATLVDVLVIILMGSAVPLASIRFGMRVLLGVIAALGAVLLVGAQLAFGSGWIVTFTYPLIALVLASVGAVAGHYLLGTFERVRVHDLFSRFVPADVVNEVIARTDHDLRLGAVRRVGTVMFTDLRGFTSFAEALEPEAVVQVINQYLGGMTEAILDHGGTLVDFMGDGIFALWGAPLEQEDHADRALAAAREMLAETLPAFNAWIAAQGHDHAFRMGIGLNTGPVMSGNVGSTRRMAYAAIGDTTNTSSRLEGMTKGTPHQIFIADSTRAALHEQHDDLVFVDEFEIRGRVAKMKVWSIDEDPLAADATPGAASAPTPIDALGASD